jgi:hypothetical protein
MSAGKWISCVITGNSNTCGFVVTINDKVKQVQKDNTMSGIHVTLSTITSATISGKAVWKFNRGAPRPNG